MAGHHFLVKVCSVRYEVNLGCEYLVKLAASLGQPIITVAIQYRLGWLGFLTSNDLESESEHSENGLGAGNWGLIDQRNAFLWIKKNIDGFGGDPNNVTAFGIKLYSVLMRRGKCGVYFNCVSYVFYSSESLQ